MYIRPEEHASYSEWLRLNKKYWGKWDFSYQDSQNVIYVDLFHDNADYLIRNLLTARHLSAVKNLPIIGLTGNIGIVPTACSISTPKLEELAESFGIHLIIVEVEIDRPKFTNLLFTALQRVGLSTATISGAALREFLQDWVMENSFPIGRYIYDTLLRKYLIETICEIDDFLTQVGAEILGFSEVLESQFANFPPEWLVSGHIDYCPYAVMADRALAVGAQCAYVRNEGLMRIYLLNGALDPGQTLLGKLRQQSFVQQTQLQQSLINSSAALLQQHSDLVSNEGFFRSYRALRSPYGIPPRSSVRDARKFLLPEFGLDPGLPTVVIFTITLADIAKSDDQVFADNYIWLEEILKFAQGQPSMNWVVRVHPYDLMFNVTGAMERLFIRYGHAQNIHFMNGSIAPRLAFVLADAATTIRGTPGLQAAELGIPTVLCGRGFYSDFGFAYVADDKEQYFDLLRKTTTSTSSEPLMLHAHAFQYCEDILFNVPTTFMGAFGECGELGYWDQLIRRLVYYSTVNDPLYHSLAQSILEAECRVVARLGEPQPDIVGSLSTTKGVLQHYSFERGAMLGITHLSGGHGPEEWGTWFGAGSAAFFLTLPEAIRGKVWIKMACQSFSHADLDVASIQLVFGEYCSEKIFPSMEKVEPVIVQVPDSVDLQNSVFLGLRVEGGGVPASANISDDQRHLAIFISYLEIICEEACWN